MTTRPTVLLISRDRRLHPMNVAMAEALARDHRVVVLATPEYAPAFAALDGVEVVPHRSGDVLRDGSRPAPADEARTRARVAAIERELGLPLFKAAGNFLLYGRIVQDFGGSWGYLRTEGEILQAFADAYEHMSAIFARVEPDVVFYEAVDLISNFLALAISRRHGAFAFEPRPSPLGVGRGSLGYGVHRRNVVMEHLLAHPELVAGSSVEEASAILAGPRESLYRTFWSATHRGMVKGQSPLNPSWWIGRLGDGQHVVRGVRNWKWHLKGVQNRIWLDRHLDGKLPEVPYVAFLLNHLPEASTCSHAPRWVNQDAIVEQLAVNAPSGLEILVKEHPRTYGRRGAEFFERLQRLPNVTLCHPSVDNFELLSGAEAILSVTGTAGFEGIVLGKRVGVLGSPFYSVSPVVRNIEHPEEIFEVMADPEWRPAEMLEDRLRFLAAYIQSLYDFGAGKGMDFYPPRAGIGWAAAVSDTLAFISRHGLRPTDFDAGLPASAPPVLLTGRKTDPHAPPGPDPAA